jgi:hypothetical protein
MTTSAASVATPWTRGRYLGIAVAASVAHMLMMIPGYNEDGNFDTTAYLSVFLVSLVFSVLVFTFIVPRGGAVAALVLSLVALASVLIFWAGLTLPLAAAGAVAAWRARQAGDRVGISTAALALSVVTAVALVAIIIGDATSN